MAETSKKSEDVEVAECQGCAVPRCCWCVVLNANIWIFQPTPIGGPTAQIESPRRALAIRAAEGEIAEGLQQNDAKVSGDRV